MDNVLTTVRDTIVHCVYYISITSKCTIYKNIYESIYIHYLNVSFIFQAINLLRGPAFTGQGGGGTKDGCWDLINLGIPSRKTITKDNGGYTTENGIIASLLKTFLLVLENTPSVVFSFKTGNFVCVPVCLSRDGMQLKPAMQIDTTTYCI